MTGGGTAPRLALDRISPSTFKLTLTGDWTRRQSMPGPLIELLPDETEVETLTFDASGVGEWDSMLVLFLNRVGDLAKERGVEIDAGGLPEGVEGIMRLADAVPERQGARRHEEPKGLFTRVGEIALNFFSSAYALLGFLGEVTLAFGRFLLGKARYRKRDLVLTIQETGFEALPIVSLISLLIGLILAFVGAIQLEKFGAGIYVADLVGVGMTREMGPIMAAIIMAGRTGAAFAAELGTMQVNEEIDAFKTLGVSPMEYLVLPRVLGLTLMMPLLVVYADVLGILGGMAVGVGMLDLNLTEYINETLSAVGMVDISIGLFKGFLFGILVAGAGCFHGISCGRSSAAVGRATTAAVVMSIVSIVVADSLVTVITTILKI
ncbi:MAG: ABC transporter permease [Pseudomonadota bacterium]|nr:ABC transporter permease [Pseudomonadota bacterium]